GQDMGQSCRWCRTPLISELRRLGLLGLPRRLLRHSPARSSIPLGHGHYSVMPIRATQSTYVTSPSFSSGSLSCALGNASYNSARCHPRGL
ncbi:hypothetical protein U1Q18_022007, partial [Sarracenia purpurea var. burkii]